MGNKVNEDGLNLLKSFDPVSLGINQGLSMLQGLGSLAKGKYDYSQEGMNLQDAVNAGSERGSAIGGFFGPLGNLIGGAIGAKRAERTANEIISNREKKMDAMLQIARDKQKEMSIFKRNDINQINNDEWAV